jgi:lipoprotein-anchoring transpeptidase ErfK/SrfK
MRRLSVLLLLVLALATASCGSVRGPAQPSPAPKPSATTTQSATPAAPPSSPSSTPPSSPAPATTPAEAGRTLLPGMSGADVAALQRRLAALHYYPGPADGQFGSNTLAAVWAFQAVQGLPARDAVTAAMWRALADPRPPAALVPGGGALRVEISLSKQVLVLYRGGQAELISHVSSGGGYYYCSPGGCGYARTPTGDFRTTTFMPGWVTVPLGEMYNPVFFIGTAYAIHGSGDVPRGPASHGCVRIPMVIAEFFHTLVPAPGTPVYIRR